MSDKEDVIWHDWDPFRQVLKVAFVGDDRIGIFTYRLCLNCGVSMEPSEEGTTRVWTCGICGGQVMEPGEP